MSERRTFVIAGGGLAGARAAETLRSAGFDGRLVLVGAEDELPYERPPLSKTYLAGASTLAEARVHERSFYDEQDVELVLGQAVSQLDTQARELRLAGGEALRYDRLLLATCAVPRRPPIPGADREDVLLLRTVADSDRLRGVIEQRGRLAIVGAGWIGSEVAATARTAGAEVTLIERAEAPLELVLGRRIGDFFAALHRSHGVELLTGATVERIAAGRVELGGGAVVEADAVVLAVGIAPATDLAAAAGLQVDDGVVTDERLRTSADGVFAAGDVAAAFHPRYGRRVRVEHWANAAEQGAAAARSMLGAEAPYAKVPFFFSDQYDLGMEYFGLHAATDRLVLRGSTESERFQAFWIGAGGIVTAALHANDWDASAALARLVEAGTRVDAEALARGDVALEELAPAP